jgi:hypothetical protein
MLAESDRPAGGEYVLPQTAALYEADAPALSRSIQNHFTACGVRTVKRGTGFKTVIDADGKERRKHTGKRAVVEVGFHSLRHTFVSLCRESNAPLAVVEAIVGHANPVMTRHYTHIGEAAAGAAVAALPALSFVEEPDVTGAVRPVSQTADTVTIPVATHQKIAERLTQRNVDEIRSELHKLAKPAQP